MRNIRFSIPAGVGAALLSCVDYTVIQIEINDIAQKTVEMGQLLPTWLFPSPSTAMPFVLWLGLFMLRLKAPRNGRRRLRFHEWLFLAVFSGTLLVCHSFWVCQSFTLITANKACLMLALFSFAALVLLGENLLCWGKYLWERLANSRLKLPDFWLRHPFLFPFSVIFLLWLPYAILKYPGGIDSDSYLQLLEPLGLFPISNHWPISSSLFFAGGFQLGRILFGSNNAGLFTAIIFQMLFCAACLAGSLKIMLKMKISGAILILTLAIYSLATIFSRYTTSLGKDCLFSSAMVLCLSMAARLLFDEAQVKTRDLVCLGAALLLMSVLRSNGPYILIFMLAALAAAWAVSRRKRLVKLLACVAGAYCLCLCYLNVLLPACGVPGGSEKEIFSLPFMQTARYVKYYPEGVTSEEAEIIDKVLDYDALAEKYSEKLSDPVKNTYHGDSESLKEYLVVWLKQGLRRPDIYFSATFNNVFGYFYPGAREDAMGIYMQYDPLNEDVEQIFSMPEQQAQRRAVRLDWLTQFIMAFENFPLFYPFCNVAAHVWAMLFMVLSAAAHKKLRMLLLLVPSITGLLICIAGPTFFHNGLRYALPIIFVNPLLSGIYMDIMLKKKAD